jgi:hypothetical protein
MIIRFSNFDATPLRDSRPSSLALVVSIIAILLLIIIIEVPVMVRI